MAKEQTAQEAPALTDQQTILLAIHAVMQDVNYVEKSGENDFHNYTYATEADVLHKLRPAMLKHGLVLIPNITQVSTIDVHGNTTIQMAYTLCHTSGAVWPEKIVFAGCGGDSHKKGVGDKGLYKAITGANKYLLFKLFQIETGDTEPEDAKGDEDRAQSDPDDQARKFYLEGALIAVSRQETAKELREWWDGEQDNRRRADVVKGTAEYSDLYAKVLRRGEELKKKEAR